MLLGSLKSLLYQRIYSNFTGDDLMFYNAVFKFMLDDSGEVDLIGVSGVSNEDIMQLSTLESDKLSLRVLHGVDMFHNAGVVDMFRGGIFIDSDRASIVLTGHYCHPVHMKPCHLSCPFEVGRHYG